MAVRITKELVCDECGSDDNVKSYRVGIVGNGRGVAPDLCEAHSERLRQLIATSPSRNVSGLRKPPKVRTTAEVKAQRRKRAPTPA